MYVYIHPYYTEQPNEANGYRERRIYDECFTVGFYDPKGEWHPESDHSTREEAAKRVAWLNGSTAQVEEHVPA